MFNFLYFLLLLPLHLVVAEEQSHTVLLAVLARNKAHVLPKYLSSIEALEYDKKLITVYINTNNNEDPTEEILTAWAQKNRNQYRAVIVESHHVDDLNSTRPHEWTAERFKVLGNIRNKSLQKAKELKSDYYFVVDCDNFVVPSTLKDLIAKQKPIIAPLLRSVPYANDPYSNYFCDVSESGYYQHHPDYMEILHRQRQGTFQVPVVHCTYLIDMSYVDRLGYIDTTNDYEFVIFSRLARKNSVDQFICNEKDFGTLLHFVEDLTLQQEVEKTEEWISSCEHTL